MIILHGTPNDKNEIMYYDYDPFFWNMSGDYVPVGIVHISFQKLENLSIGCNSSDYVSVEHSCYELIKELGVSPPHYKLVLNG